MPSSEYHGQLHPAYYVHGVATGPFCLGPYDRQSRAEREARELCRAGVYAEVRARWACRPDGPPDSPRREPVLGTATIELHADASGLNAAVDQAEKRLRDFVAKTAQLAWTVREDAAEKRVRRIVREEIRAMARAANFAPQSRLS